MIDSQELRKILPQEYPFLMIDKVLEYEKGKSLTAVKNITANEWSVGEGRFPIDHFPETLLIEAASQAALVLYQLSKIKVGEKRPQYILGRITANFLTSIVIGDQLRIKALANKMLDSGGYSDINLSVGVKKIAEIEIIYSVKR